MDVVPFDVATFDVATFDVATFDVATFDVVTFDVATFDIASFEFLVVVVFFSVSSEASPSAMLTSEKEINGEKSSKS